MRIAVACQLAFLTLLAGGCGEAFDDRGAPDGTAEPGAAPEAVAPAAVENVGRPPDTGSMEGPWSLEAVATAFQREPDLTIGALQEPECELFGSVRDVAVDGAGRVYVLDAMERTVRVFSIEGECLFEVGRGGSGPAELREPVALDLSDDGRLRILDWGNERIVQFDVSGPTPRRLDSVPVPGQGIDLCSMGDRVFVAAHSASSLLFELDDSGAVVHAAGALAEGQYRPVSAPEKALCWEPAETILLASRHRAGLQWFEAGGERLFERELPDFVEAAITQRDGRMTGFEPGLMTRERPISFFPLAGGTALLQTGVPQDLLTLTYHSLKTYTIALDGGAIERMDVIWPHIFVARDSVLVAAHHGWVPRIGIWRRSVVP